MFESAIRKRLAEADIVPGRGHSGDPVVIRPGFYRRVALSGAMGLGESYVDGDWECPNLDVFVYKATESGITEPGMLQSLFATLRAGLRRRADASGAHYLGEVHYSRGNDLYRAMLGPTMAYTCALWSPKATTLDMAQTAKFDLVCRKLRLKRGMTILDIGCGWGGFLRYASMYYGVTGIGVTVAREQVTWAQAWCEGLPISIEFLDYRSTTGLYDRVVSLGMFEHVEREFSRAFMRVFHDRIRPGGIGLLHTIGKDRPSETNPWIREYVFPLGDIPTRERIRVAAEGLLSERHRHVMGGEQYDLTLMAWYHNIQSAWEELKTKYDERFYRILRFYLLGCAGIFRARELDVWQILFTRSEDPFSLRDQPLYSI